MSAHASALNFERAIDGRITMRLETLGCTCVFQIERHVAVIALGDLLAALEVKANREEPKAE